MKIKAGDLKHGQRFRIDGNEYMASGSTDQNGACVCLDRLNRLAWIDGDTAVELIEPTDATGNCAIAGAGGGHASGPYFAEQEKAAEDIFPPKPWLDPGEGWRLLEGDEIVQKGDSVYDSRIGQWSEMHSPLSPSVVVLLGYSWIKAVRRRVEPDPPQCALTQGEAEKINQIQSAIDRKPQVKQANSIQHGGYHYRSKPIQPWDYIASNGLGFFEGNIVKYVTRWPERGGLVDLKKAQHYIEKLIEIETAKETGQ